MSTMFTSVIVGYAYYIPGSGMPALGSTVLDTLFAIEGALRIGLFDESVPIKKAPELVGRM